MSALDRNFICRMPPELLGEIFVYASHGNSDAPLVICAVCTTFSIVLLSTPLAWLSLHLVVPDVMDRMDNAKSVRKAQKWFIRAGVCLVDLKVEISPRRIEIPRVMESEVEGRITSDEEDWFLPLVLRKHIHRIRTLELHSTTAEESQAFISLIYPPPLAEPSDESKQISLQSLVLSASSDGLRAANYSNSLERSQNASASFTFPQFTNLQRLKFRNHLLPDLTFGNAKILLSLSIVYPLRFAPISMSTLLHVLNATANLERFEIEARIVDSFPLQNHATPDKMPKHPALTSLPSLSHLHLRINNLPSLLSHLLLPSLHTLKIDDLDGKRLGGSLQSAAVLRGMLVRMELPCDRRKGDGLKLLEMSGVPISSVGFTRRAEENSWLGHHLHSNYGPEDCETAESIWEWCFRRMRTLTNLRIKKMDNLALLDLITPRMELLSSNNNRLELGTTMIDDIIPLPKLQKLEILDNIAEVSPVTTISDALLQPIADSHENVCTRGPILKFRLRRPDVEVFV